MGGHTGVEWPALFQAEKLSERFAGNATPPKFAVDPLADLAFPISPKTADVPRDLAIGYDCLFQAGVVCQDLCPVLVEFSFIARTEYDHRDRHGISLMFEKDGQIVRFDVAQVDAGFMRQGYSLGSGQKASLHAVSMSI